MRKILFHEIFTSLKDHEIEDKITILQENDTTVLRQLLMAALEPAVLFDVEIPAYRNNKEVDGYATNSLMIEARRLYIFLTTNRNVSPKRKKEILGQMLESIDPSDAKLLIQVIKKDLSEYGLTAEVVNGAWPGLIKG